MGSCMGNLVEGGMEEWFASMCQRHSDHQMQKVLRDLQALHRLDPNIPRKKGEHHLQFHRLFHWNNFLLVQSQVATWGLFALDAGIRKVMPVPVCKSHNQGSHYQKQPHK